MNNCRRNRLRREALRCPAPKPCKRNVPHVALDVITLDRMGLERTPERLGLLGAVPRASIDWPTLTRALGKEFRPRKRTWLQRHALRG